MKPIYGFWPVDCLHWHSSDLPQELTKRQIQGPFLRYKRAKQVKLVQNKSLFAKQDLRDIYDIRDFESH